MCVDDAGEGRKFFSREKKFRPSPAPPSHFKKSGVLIQLFGIIGNKAKQKKLPAAYRAGSFSVQDICVTWSGA